MFRFIMNVFCLLIWIGWLIHGIDCCVKKKEVSKIGFICAVLVCIVYYIGQVAISLTT